MPEPIPPQGPAGGRRYPLGEQGSQARGCLGCGVVLLLAAVGYVLAAKQPILGAVGGVVLAIAGIVALVAGQRLRSQEAGSRRLFEEARREAAVGTGLLSTGGSEARAAGLASALEAAVTREPAATVSARTASAAAAALFERVLPAVPDCPRRLVFVQAFELSKAWGATELSEWPAERARAGVELELNQVAAHRDFQGFSVRVLTDANAVQVEASMAPRRTTRTVAIDTVPGLSGRIVETGPGTVLPLRVWKSGGSLFACAHPVPLAT